MREMKDSGISWIGEIPKSWKVLPHKQIMHKDKSLCEKYSGQDIISLTMGGVVIRDLDAGGKMPTTFDGYQFVEPGDILQCLFDIDVTPRCVGLVRNYGLTSPAYSRFKVHNGFHNAYYDYLLRAIDDKKVFVHLSKNLRSSLNEEDFGAIKSICPPFSEQVSIADFLDRKCIDIENVLEKTRASIEEYKNLRQSVITEAVTNGIRGKRKMKDSGIEWAPKVPLEWEVKRVKKCVDTFLKGTGITKDEIFSDGNTPCVRYGEIYSKYGNTFEKCVSATNLDIQSAPQYFSKGDILCAATGELVEEIGKSIAYLGETPCLAGGDIIIIHHKQDPSFFNYALNSSYAQAQKSSKKTKLKVVHISASDIGDVIIALPSLEEQREIARYLDQKCAEINILIASKEKFIAELESYKKSLIYEYATGKRLISE